MVNSEELEGVNILQPYNKFIEGLMTQAFEVEETPVEDKQLTHNFLLHCLVVGYDFTQLPNLQEKFGNDGAKLISEVIENALSKIDSSRYQKKIAAVSGVLKEIDFSKPQKPFDFLLKLGLLDPESDMYQLWQAITSAMPKDFQSVLAVQSF